MNIPHGCPYQVDDDCNCNDRNRFPHHQLFVGEIENGKRYPYDVYSKEEADERYNALEARVEALEYKDIEINGLAITPPVCEIGSTNSIVIAWELNKEATTQNINGENVTGNTKLYTDVTSPQAYTLIVSDGKTSTSKSISSEFANQIYYGALASLTSATITSLPKVLSNDKARTITVDADNDKYIVYAIPARLGGVTFFANGFEGGFEEPVEYILTNASGYREAYNVYRSTNLGLGTTTVDVREV